MNDDKTGGPAFPQPAGEAGCHRCGYDYPTTGDPGMTLWDYYAGKALTGFVSGVIANPNYMPRAAPPEEMYRHYAADAAGCADAMIAERNKRWPR